MALSSRLLILAPLWFTACGGGGGAANTTAPPATPGAANGPCDVRPAGPLIGITYQPGPEPPATGGVLNDGTYDLVAVVDYHGQRKASEPPQARMALRFIASERSSNHTQGRLDVAGGVPPAETCTSGGFATTGTVLRQMLSRSIDDQSYSVTPDGFTMVPNVQNLDRMTYVFRRRP